MLVPFYIKRKNKVIPAFPPVNGSPGDAARELLELLEVSEEEVQLFKGIAADRESDTPRLVYADWLMEHNRHREAELIKTQLEQDASLRPPITVDGAEYYLRLRSLLTTMCGEGEANSMWWYDLLSFYLGKVKVGFPYDWNDTALRTEDQHPQALLVRGGVSTLRMTWTHFSVFFKQLRAFFPLEEIELLTAPPLIQQSGPTDNHHIRFFIANWTSSTGVDPSYTVSRRELYSEHWIDSAMGAAVVYHSLLEQVGALVGVRVVMAKD